MKLHWLAMSTLGATLPIGIWLNTSFFVPDLEVTNHYNLGTVVKGKVAVIDLPVRNIGKSPLKIAGISTSCGCTTTQLSSMTIPPGGQANLHIEYDSKAHESDLGSLERFVFIASNDPQEGDFQIKLSVFVEKK